MSEQLIENIIVYGFVLLLCGIVVWIYLRKQARESRQVEEKIEKAKETGLYEPISLHPVIDENSCIKTGACIIACPERDIIGIRRGKATAINASRCVGHGACFHACPTQAISLCIGTETRGVDLPHVNQKFESNVPGISIAGELGGMGLIKNAAEQGKQAVEYLTTNVKKQHNAAFDLLIVGAGPAGISASLTAKKNNLKFITLEQDTLGGTVFTFPRSKIVMTSPMDLPLYGKVKLNETNKAELLKVWNEALNKNDINIQENCKVESITAIDDYFEVETLNGKKYTAKHVLLAIGRRGTPRKLEVPGEITEKVAYRLLEPEHIERKNILVVGGGDSAVESAMLLAEHNKVTLSYRKESFSRVKPKNSERINKAIKEGKVEVLFNTNVKEIRDHEVLLLNGKPDEPIVIKNDLVYIFAGGELPTQFLKKIGLEITKKYGEALLKH
ncbi:MAG TPA: NAD(P)-binding domain-containing protein [Bacteroidales bacterium]|nr:NAD(P)-binding domain-containing protein [Bacteroidales bacterium]HRX96516.1 NAD(P)-binding domain-containing protein [Bacteroidales bacterium]